MVKQLRNILLLILLFLAANEYSFAALGDNTNPAKSCYHIKLTVPTATDGVYFIQSPTMSSPAQFYCDMTINGGGWLLLFQKQIQGRNIEDCGNHLNDFLQNSCGQVSNLGSRDSYSTNVTTTLSGFNQQEYMVIQSNGTTQDTDDAYIMHTDKNLFPNTQNLENLTISKICDINNSNCDSTDVYWKYTGNSYFSGTRCSNGRNGSTFYKGNYGYCHNGLNNYLANSLFGNRNGYAETKLWNYGSGSRNFYERVYIRSYEGSVEDIQLSNTQINISSNGSGIVGTLSSIESGYTGGFTYTLVGTNNDNNYFSITGNTLNILNNAKSNYTIKIRSTDDNGLFLEKDFTLENTFAPGGQSNPIESCQKFKTANPSAQSKTYWMQNSQMTSPIQVYCEMNLNGGGWNLLFQRRGGEFANNTETCGSNLNRFLQNTCGNPGDIGYDKSYSIGVENFLSKVDISEYMVVQYNTNMTTDGDDAYTLSSSENIFPNNIGQLNEFTIQKICDINSSNCDSTDVIWKYVGTSWYHSSLCNQNNYSGSTTYKGNYGYCHNGYDGNASSGLFGNRNAYNETKLWGYNSGADNYMERVLVKIEDGDTIQPTITNATPLENEIFPGNSKDITISYTDDTAIDTSSATISLQKWNSNNNTYEPAGTSNTTPNITTTSANYSFNNLTYGKYKYTFSISDTSGNTQTVEKVFYMDYPIVTIDKSQYDFGSIIPGMEHTSETVTVQVKTIGGAFNIIATNDEIPSYNIHTIQNWNGLLGFAIQNQSTAWKLFAGETIGTQTKNINTDGNYNTYTYTFKFAIKVNSQQAAGDYTGLFGIDAVFNY